MTVLQLFNQKTQQKVAMMNNNEISKVLKKFNFSQEEIASIINDNDNIAMFDKQEIIDNLNLLVYKGIPMSEISEVINLNHTLLFHDTEYLDKILQEVIDEGNDLEEYLKDNPDVIC